MAGVSRRDVLAAGALAAAGFAGVLPSPVHAQPAWNEPPNGLSASAREAVAALAEGFLRAHGIAGLSIAAGRNGRIVHARGFGVADAATGAPVTPAHLFRIADVSKPFTAVLVFALIEQGRLRRSDRVCGEGGILQDDFGHALRDPRAAAITVEHLLTHTAGGWAADADDPMRRQPSLDQNGLVAWTLANVPLTAAPGTAFAYSHFGYCLLGRVIEKVMHQYYATAMRDLVFHRCGIADMRIAGSTAALRAPTEVAYGGPDDGAYGIDVARMDAAAGWIASAGDLVRFAMGVDGAHVPPLLRRPTLMAMTAPLDLRRSYARGFEIADRDWRHFGSLPGTSAVLVRTPAGLCYAALANGRNSRTDSVAGIARMMREMVAAAKGFA